MKGVSGKILNMASVAVLGTVIYLLISNGLFTAIGKEVERYGDINTSYLYIFAAFVIGSYGVGWVFSKLRTNI